MEQVQELFALPENPKIATKLEGVPFYTSDRIQERFVKALAKSDYFSDVIREIDNLVRNKKAIVPCWQTSSAIKFITKKILQSIEGLGFAAFYEPNQRKIFIVLDNYINWFLSYPNKVLARVASHELVHYCADREPNKFLAIFKDYIRDYYILFFKDIFKIPKGQKIDDEVWKIVVQMHNGFGAEVSVASIMSKYEKVMLPLKKYSKDPDKFDKNVEDMKQCIKLVAVYGGKAQDILFSGYMHILSPMYRTYDALDVPTYGNVCFQELWRPEEVIALHVEKKILKDKFTTMMKSLS
jgi:hypothetical protein